MSAVQEPKRPDEGYWYYRAYPPIDHSPKKTCFWCAILALEVLVGVGLILLS